MQQRGRAETAKFDRYRGSESALEPCVHASEDTPFLPREPEAALGLPAVVTEQGMADRPTRPAGNRTERKSLDLKRVVNLCLMPWPIIVETASRGLIYIYI